MKLSVVLVISSVVVADEEVATVVCLSVVLVGEGCVVVDSVVAVVNCVTEVVVPWVVVAVQQSSAWQCSGSTQACCSSQKRFP